MTTSPDPLKPSKNQTLAGYQINKPPSLAQFTTPSQVDWLTQKMRDANFTAWGPGDPRVGRFGGVPRWVDIDMDPWWMVIRLAKVASIHGDMPQKERDAIMQQSLPQKRRPNFVCGLMPDMMESNGG